MARGELPLIRRARRPGAAFQINPVATDRNELASASSSPQLTASLILQLLPHRQPTTTRFILLNSDKNDSEKSGVQRTLIQGP